MRILWYLIFLIAFFVVGLRSQYLDFYILGDYLFTILVINNFFKTIVDEAMVVILIYLLRINHWIKFGLLRINHVTQIQMSEIRIKTHTILIDTKITTY